MGGNVFITPAQRLSTPELLLLLKQVKERLGPLFNGMEINRFYESKTSHGDLDVLCGLGMDGDGWKGADQDGNISSGQDVGDRGKEFENKGDGKSLGLGKVEGKEWTREDVRLFAELCAIKLGASKWKKHGWEISFAIPCSIIGVESTGPDDVSHAIEARY